MDATPAQTGFSQERGRWLGVSVLVAAAILTGLIANFLVAILPFDRPWIIAAGLLSAFAIAISYRRPAALILFVLGYDLILGQIPKTGLALFGFNRILFYALILIPLLLSILWRAARSKSFRIVIKADIFIVLFLLANSISVITATDGQAAISGITYLTASLAIIYLVRLIVYKSEDIGYIVSLLIAVLIAEALLAAYQYITGIGLQFVASGERGQLVARAGGTLGNSLGGYLSIGFVLALNYLLWARRRRQLIWGGMVTGIMAMGVLFTNTRGTWIDCTVLAILSIMLAIRRKTTVVAILILSTLLATILVVSPAGNQLGVRVNRILDEIQSSDVSSFSFRLTLWQAAIRMFDGHPWTGIGIGNYYYSLASYLSPDEIRTISLQPDSSYSAHNVALESLAETGLVGSVSLILMLGAIWLLARNGWRTYDLRRRGIAAAFLVYTIACPLSMSYGGYLRAGSFYFVVVGLIMAAAYLRSSKRANQTPNPLAVG